MHTPPEPSVVVDCRGMDNRPGWAVGWKTWRAMDSSVTPACYGFLFRSSHIENARDSALTVPRVGRVGHLIGPRERNGEQEQDESKVSSVNDFERPEYEVTPFCAFSTRHVRGLVTVYARIQHPCEGMENLG